MGQDLVIQKNQYRNDGRRGGMLLPCVRNTKDGKLTRRTWEATLNLVHNVDELIGYPTPMPCLTRSPTKSKDGSLFLKGSLAFHAPPFPNCLYR